MTTEIVNRGGSWLSTAGSCRSANRNGDSPSLRDFHLGFRVLREKKKKEKKIEYRVNRGGSWGSSAGICRSAYRRRGIPSYRGNRLGFRVLKEKKKKKIEYRVLRGGSWLGSAAVTQFSSPVNCRSANRRRLDPSYRSHSIGFRVIKEKKEKKVEYRVIRGGGWCGTAEGCRSAFRDGSLPSSRYNSIGFRVLKESKDDN